MSRGFYASSDNGIRQALIRKAQLKRSVPIEGDSSTFKRMRDEMENGGFSIPSSSSSAGGGGGGGGGGGCSATGLDDLAEGGECVFQFSFI